MNQVENLDFKEKTVPQWRSRSEASYGSLKTPKTAFPDQKITKHPENGKKNKYIKTPDKPPLAAAILYPALW